MTLCNLFFFVCEKPGRTLCRKDITIFQNILRTLMILQFVINVLILLVQLNIWGEVEYLKMIVILSFNCLSSVFSESRSRTGFHQAGTNRKRIIWRSI